MTDTNPGFYPLHIDVGNSSAGWNAFGGNYSTSISNLWGDTATSPDGDDWHFHGYNDSGSAFLYTKPGEVTGVTAAARVETQFSVHHASTTDKGMRWVAKVGTSWYATDEFGTNGATNGTVTGGGLVSVWAQETINVESATWYLWDDTAFGGDTDPSNGNYPSWTPVGISSTPIAGLPDGDIDAERYGAGPSIGY